MTEEPNEAQEPNRAGDAAQPTFPTSESLPVTVLERIPSTQKGNAGKNNSDSAPSVARELHWLEKLNIAGQMGLVVVGIVAASIYGCQLHVMQGQLCVMTQQLKEMHTASAQAMIAATTAKDSFDLTREQAEDTLEAICNVGFNVFNDDIGQSWLVNVRNDGKMTAKNFHLRVEFSRMKIPEEQRISKTQTYEFSDLSEFPPTPQGGLYRRIQLKGDAVANLSSLSETKEAEIAQYFLSYDNGFGTFKTKSDCFALLVSPHFSVPGNSQTFRCNELAQRLKAIDDQHKAAGPKQ